jgi:hypothetical protein
MANVLNGSVDNNFTVYESAARTATPDTQEYELPAGAKYGHFVLDVTAVVATPALTFKIEGVDRLSGKVYTILVDDAPVATAVTTVFKVGPGLTAVGGSVANDFLPPVVRFTVTHGDADSATYTLSAAVA